VARNQARLRITFSAAQYPEDVALLTEALENIGGQTSAAPSAARMQSTPVAGSSG
jgi:hypothetical protein